MYKKLEVTAQRKPPPPQDYHQLRQSYFQPNRISKYMYIFFVYNYIMTFVQLHRQAIKDPIGGLYHVDIGVLKFVVYDVDIGVMLTLVCL